MGAVSVPRGHDPLIPRTLMMLIDADAKMADRPLDLRSVWLEISGLTLEQFIRVGLAYLDGATKSGLMKRHDAASGAFTGIVTKEDCDAFLQMTSATYEEFRELSKPYRGDDRYVKTEFNVLNQRPLIGVGEEIVVPVPKLLLQRITRGVLYDLRDHFPNGQGTLSRNISGTYSSNIAATCFPGGLVKSMSFTNPSMGSKRGPDQTGL